MFKKVSILLFIIVEIFTVVSYADELDSEEFHDQEIWMQIQDVDTNISQNPPKINSRAAIIFDRKSKAIIYGKNVNQKRAMASTTKVMTAIVALEKGNLNDTIEVSKKAASINGSKLGLKTGDKISLKDLLYGLLLRSGNDAAIQIALHLGGSIEGFAQMMNDKANELGLKNTHFVTPHGLDNENHYTTVYELALLTDYALNNKEFAKIVSTKQTVITINSKPVTINNTNELLGNLEGVNGVKTGFTNNAGRCLITSITRNNFSIITIVLGADTKKFRTKDSIELIEYNYKNYEPINIKEKVVNEFEIWKNRNLKNFEIIKAKKNNIDIELDYNYNFEEYPIKKTDVNNIKIQIQAKTRLNAPIYQEEQIGQIHVILNENEILTVPIIVKEDIEKKDIWYNFIEIMKNYIKIIIGGL